MSAPDRRALIDRGVGHAEFDASRRLGGPMLFGGS